MFSETITTLSFLLISSAAFSVTAEAPSKEISQEDSQLTIKVQDPFASERERVDKSNNKKVTTPSILVLSQWGTDINLAIARFKLNGIMQHYIIDPKGTVYNFVDESHRAWHAGVSGWRKIRDVNSHSIGISLLSKCGTTPTTQQIQKLGELGQHLMKKYNISADNVLGLSEVAIPYGRHVAPCEGMDWKTLAKVYGVGLWVDEPKDNAPTTIRTKVVNFSELKSMLKNWGYDLGEKNIQTNELDEETKNLVKALHKRYDAGVESTERASGEPTSKTVELVRALILEALKRSK